MFSKARGKISSHTDDSQCVAMGRCLNTWGLLKKTCDFCLGILSVPVLG